MTIELIHGDCLEVVSGMKSKSIDLVLTDPPYGVTNNKWDKVIDPNLWMISNCAICFGIEPFTAFMIN